MKWNDILSFVELEKKENVTSEEITNTLKDYAETWAAIVWKVVVWLLQRAEMTNEDLSICLQEAQTWALKQNKMGFRDDSLQYLDVVKYIENALKKLKQKVD